MNGREPLFSAELPVSISNCDENEILQIINKLKSKKSPGHDDLPAELWRAAAESPILITWIKTMCNRILASKEIPASWKVAKVACLFKKGDPAMPENYRPISLLAIGYKVFAALLLHRLRLAGAEQRIISTQYGFRKGVGTRDTIFVLRRLLEK